MNTLFHSDLLNFGTIIIALMIVGGVVVVLTMVGDNAWRILYHTDKQDDQADAIGPKRDNGERGHWPKSA